MARKPLIAGALAGLVLLAAACGGDDDDGSAATDPPATSSADAAAETAATSEPDAPTSAPSGGSTVSSTSAEPGSDASAPDGDVPQRIISLSPPHTETLFAIGAGPQVIAVDEQSDYPPEVLDVQTDLSGYTPNVEAIAGYEPDLVVLSGDPTTAGQLEALGIEVWQGPAAETFDEAYTQMEQLGALTGHVAEAAELVAQLQTELDELVASVPELPTPLSVYHELTPDGYSAGSGTFIGQIYELFGLRNIADAAEDPSGFPQLNSETIIQANPDLIFLADTECCGESIDTVAARDGWADIAAVVNGNVFEMSDDVASRWGPRFVEYARQVRDALEQAVVPAG